MYGVPGGRTAAVACATVLLSLLTALAPPAAHATHFRYGTINWLPGSGNAVQFRVKNAWRRNADNCFSVTTNNQISCTGAGGLPGVGDIIREDTGSTRFAFGDGNTIGSPGNHALYYQVTSVDTTNNWLFGEALDETKLPAVNTTITHTYASTGTYTAGLDTCCRISASVSPNAHINNPDVAYRVQAIVTVGGTFAGNSSPVSNIIPIVTCFINSICTFQVPATDPNGDTLHWRMATSTEASGSSTAFTQPGPPDATNAATINLTTGLYTWDTHGATLGASGLNTLYSTQVIVEDLTPGGTVKSHIPVDFLIQLIPKVNHAPAFSSPTCGSTQTVAAGSLASFNVTANDSDVGDTVTLNVAGLPGGATMSPPLPTSGNPVTSLFNWTPAGTDVGTFVVVYSATDGDGQQVQCSITLNVTCTLALCDDGNVCTTDTCSNTGCVHTNNTNSCNDGNACTASDVCSGGVCGGTTISCNDGNVCTDDTCSPATGCIHTNNTASCSDGSACTTNDTCSNGACVGGAAPNCDDGNVCTTDACVPATGCTHTNNTASCSDGNACTTNDTCAGGSCVGGAAPNCNDGNGCTDDSCNPSTGCVHANNTAPCNDGSACTTNDTCAGGSCVGGPAPNCNDGNVCTTDACNPATGCTHTNNTVACSDGNACTSGDTCAGGVCVGGGATNCNDGNGCTDDSCNTVTGCVHANNTSSCNDGDACTTNDTCAGGTCVGGAAPNCDDGNVCTNDTCNSGTGCVHVNNTAPCDDGDACTTSDTCGGGTCHSGAALDCNDGNVCTDDSCNSATGCVHVDNTAPCSTGNACTTNNVCSGGSCGGGNAVSCDDNNPCTTDTCSPTSGCGHTNNTLPCDDGNACTTNDTCGGGTCHGGAAPNCNDGNVCTTDACDSGTGCTHTNNTGPCNDGDACTTNDTCAGGSCVGGPAPNCNDNNGCTDDSCNNATGCVHTNNTAPCNDGSFCTTNDTCAGGSCVGGAAPNCDDGNVCTTDACVPATGCTHTNNTASCSDGNACTTGDTCAGGSCVGGPAPNCNDGNGCTDDSCNNATGCVHTNNTAPCSDGTVCTTGDVCGGGTCHGGAALNCDDGNVCTNDSCDPIAGCQHANNTAPCSDGSVCTTNDVCGGGTCHGGTAVSCDDGNPCTNDSCDPIAGCQHANNTAACNDGNVCTTGEVCSGGTCQGGTSLTCNDGNPCTDDGCNPLSGCFHNNNTAPCNDGNACTTNDVCGGGTCHGGAAPDCDDGNPCTNDSCNPGSGCQHVNNTAPCDDGSICTSNDHCAGGACVGGNPTVCPSDGNPCTRDVCDPIAGCVHPLDSCDDHNICTTDSCNPLSGCQHVANASPCDDGNHCTQGDVCRNGTCVGGPAFFVDKTGKFNNGADIGSNVGANSAKSLVRLSKNVFMHDGTVASADSVVLSNGASAWDVLANKTKLASGAVIRNSTSTPVLPFTPTFCPTPDSPTPCNPGAPINVPTAGLIGPLAPGVYGDVVIGANGALILAPGNFTFCSIRTSKHVTIQQNGPGQSIIDVTGSLKLADDSDLFPFPVGAPAPIIYVGGPLVRVGAATHVTATIFAPNATVRLGRTSFFDGTFCSSKTSTDKEITLICNSPSGAFLDDAR